MSSKYKAQPDTYHLDPDCFQVHEVEEITKAESEYFALMSDARRRSAWDYPKCPNCESEVFVETTHGDTKLPEYSCSLCDTRFSKD